MKREYWFVLLVYIVMQLSSFIGVPLMIKFLDILGKDQTDAIPYWLILSFSIALIMILFILRKEISLSGFERKGSSLGLSFIWAIFGIFLALFAQTVAANIERFFGVPVGSETHNKF